MLKIIADRVGLSQSTVSQILNRKAGNYCSEENRRRIFQAAEELGYKQNFGHKLLRGDKTKTVAIILSMQRLVLEEQNQILVLLLLSKFEKAGFNTYLETISGTNEENLKKVKELILRGTDHFIWLGDPSNSGALEREIASNGRTVIGYASGFSRNFDCDVLHSVDSAIRSFLQEGHSKFKLLLGASTQGDRIQTVCNIFPELTVNEVIRRHIVFLDFEGEIEHIDTLTAMGYEKTREIMSAEPEVTALMYLSDYFMLGGIQYLYENGYEIGKDIVLCGHNNIHAVRNNIFPCRTWEIDMETTASMLFEECAGSGELHRLIKNKPIIYKGVARK